MSRRQFSVPAGLVVALALAACGSSSSTTSTSPASSGPTGSITVLAAASLTKAFDLIDANFEKAHPGTTITVSYGASSALATQITQGAPADVFASASQKTMDSVVSAGKASASTPFAKNVMEVVVPADNPAQISALADLAKPGVKVALCQQEVPCGATAAKVFANAQLTVKPVTEEADVKATLAKVTLGEVDAAVVYVTDALAAGDKVKAIEIPTEVNASTAYPIATVTGTANQSLAEAFVAYVLSPEGQKVLADAGFVQP